jgi:hypothetical protein
MANEEQLELIKQGVDAWNKWRAADAAIRPDLSEANLNEVNLTGAAARKTQDQERLPKARTAGAGVGRA